MIRNAIIAVGVLVGACASASSRSLEGIPPVQGEMRSSNGIRFVDIATGTGESMAPRKCVYTHYTGWLADGTKFDSSHDVTSNGTGGEPVAFIQGTGRVMPGWEVGFNGMRVGGRRRLYIPYQLGYGEKGNPPLIPARAALTFDVELMAVADADAHQCRSWKSVSGSG
ncbi:MAG: FKBP-type peptidyl-prolyl cis-trans isomerase [bacterium]